MRTFLREQLERFLEAVDAALAEPVEVIVIGGTAAALHYGVTRATHDIDTWTNVRADLAAAAKKARTVTGLDVPLQKSGVADAPFDFESRLDRVLPKLRRLRVLVPERHDLVLMKAVRCYEHDLEAIAEIHSHSPLELDVLQAAINLGTVGEALDRVSNTDLDAAQKLVSLIQRGYLVTSQG